MAPNEQDERLDEVAPLDDLMAMAEITEDDIANAVDWWNENASEAWKGAIDGQTGTQET